MECQFSSFLFDDPSSSLRKMTSTVNLYDYLTSNISLKTLFNHTGDDDDDDVDDQLNATSPITMTSSDSSDSAIVSDDIDDIDLASEENS
ncbi:unnamed protein product, partial [Rotaria magnacalcarata]